MDPIDFGGQMSRSPWASLINMGCMVMLRFASSGNSKILMLSYQTWGIRKIHLHYKALLTFHWHDHMISKVGHSQNSGFWLFMPLAWMVPGSLGTSNVWIVCLFVSQPGHNYVKGANVIASPGVGVGCVNKNFNIGHNLNTIRGRAFIFHMCIPYYKAFHMYHNFLPWPWSLTYFWKTLTLAIT